MAEKQSEANQLSSTSIENFSSQEVLVKNEKRSHYISSLSTKEKVYSPYEHRDLKHPNSYFGAFLHMVKSSLGTGILAVPGAYKNSGLLVGIIGNVLVGILCTHTIYMLVQASLKAASRAKVPSLGFSDSIEEVFKQGPRPIQKYARFAKNFIEISLVSTYYLSMGVYMVFISVSLTELFSYYYPEAEAWDKYLLKLILMMILMVLTQIREIKHMVPFSVIANLMLMVAFSITGYYLFSGLDSSEKPEVKLTNGLAGIPLFFSTLLFAMEGIGTIMPLENSMVEEKFLGYRGVLISSMTVIVFFFMSMGFFGYYRYGEETKVTITMNLPTNEIPAQVARAAIATSVFFSFMLQFYVPTDILWTRMKDQIAVERHNIVQIGLRIIMLLVVTGIAIAGGKNLGPLIDLIGAICFSSLGLLIPAITDIIVKWEEGWGILHWKLIKNTLILLLAIFAMVSGTYYAILEMTKLIKNEDDSSLMSQVIVGAGRVVPDTLESLRLIIVNTLIFELNIIYFAKFQDM